MLGQLVPLVLFFLCLASGLWLIWRRVPRGQPSGREMACVACGAPAALLTNFTCPNCNADVRALGIAPAAARGRRRLHPLVAVTLWSAVVTAGAATIVMGYAFRKGELTRLQYTLESGIRGPLRSVDLVANLHRRDGQTLGGDAVVTLIADDAIASLEVDAARMRATLIGDDGRMIGPASPADPFATETFDELARAAGVDPTSDLGREQMLAVRDLFQSMVRRGAGGMMTVGGSTGFGSAGGGASTSGVTALATGRWVLAAASALWLLGILRMLRPKREKTSPERNPHPATAAPGGAA